MEIRAQEAKATGKIIRIKRKKKVFPASTPPAFTGDRFPKEWVGGTDGT